MNRLDDLRIRQLDEQLVPLRGESALRTPRGGWVKIIRQALGMSMRQLAVRTGMSKSSVASAEKLEAKGTVRLDTLHRLAKGLDCELVYVLVPTESLEASLRHQARRKAGLLVGRVSDSMDLEAQGVGSAEQGRQRTELADELLRTRGRDFWNV